jgi:haloalkane dehalogenase
MIEQPLEKKAVTALGREMAYHERGTGAPILFLHGNPTSSYIWRNVIPALEGQGRLIAPDLIGMGASEKLPNVLPDTYRFTTHRYHLWAFIDAVIGLQEKVLLVIHDWGAALGFDWANHHRDRVRGIAYMEAIVRPFTPDDGSSELRPAFMALRSDEGEDLILKQNIFVERILPSLVLRKLSDVEMSEYRKPFLKSADRWPTLTWPRQIPIAGHPADVVAIADSYAKWMSENDLPKMFVNAEPGAILTGQPREFCRSWKNQTEVTVSGRHYIQEDSGPEIGRAIASWIREHRI